MEQKQNRRGGAAFFGFALAFAAPVFLWNPEYTLLDLLPDCIGYFLLALSLRRMRDLNSYFEAAASGFLKLSGVKLIRFLMFFLTTGVLDSKERPVASLLILFGFSIGELLLSIPAWKNYYEGFSFAGFVYREKRGKNGEAPVSSRARTERMASSAIAFAVGKELLILLPEFSVLAEQEYIDRGVRWNEFTALFRLLGMMVLAVWGLLWLWRTERFLAETVKNNEGFRMAEQQYRGDIFGNPTLMLRRRITLCLALFSLAAVFSFDLRVDGINFTPDLISALCLLLLFLLSRGLSGPRVAGAVLSAAAGALSVVQEITYMRFLSRYSFDRVCVDPEAYRGFLGYFPWFTATAVLLCAAMLCAFVTVGGIIREHCGYIPEGMSHDARKNKLAAVRRTLGIRLWITAGFTVLAFAVTPVAEWFSATDLTLLGDSADLVCLLCIILSAILCIRLAMLTDEEVKSRFLLS